MGGAANGAVFYATSQSTVQFRDRQRQHLVKSLSSQLCMAGVRILGYIPKQPDEVCFHQTPMKRKKRMRKRTNPPPTWWEELVKEGRREL